MRLLYCLFLISFFIKFSQEKILHGCRFAQEFYQTHSNIFELDNNQTFLTVRPLYSLSNQSNSLLSIGIIYRLANTYLVPVPLLFKCPQSEYIHAPIDCDFTIIDTRSDLSIQTAESTRTTTAPLYFKEHSSFKTRGAYFKQSKIALRYCRLNTQEENLFISDVFHLHIQFEQMINSPCEHTCIHPELYECSSVTNTCQCRLNQTGIEKFGELCVDTEVGSNCSLTSERCRRICRISDQIHTGKIDFDCQCPLGTKRILLNNMHHCQLSDCNDEKIRTSCPKGFVCREKRCLFVKSNQIILSIPVILIALLVGAFLIIIILIISLIKMRSVKCVKFVHRDVLKTHSNNLSSITITRLSSPCSTLSSSSKSTNNICEKYTKINVYE